MVCIPERLRSPACVCTAVCLGDQEKRCRFTRCSIFIRAGLRERNIAAGVEPCGPPANRSSGFSGKISGNPRGDVAGSWTYC